MEYFSAYLQNYEKAVVVGTGSSALACKPENSLKIGVNDVFKIISVDHLICVDYPAGFSNERLKIIKQSTPKLFISPIDEWKKYFPTNFAEIKLASFRSELSEIEKENVYPYSIMSPYVGIVHAYKLGCKEIILYGVDLVNHKTLSEELKTNRILRDIQALNIYLQSKNVSLKVYNKSSKLSEVLNHIENC